MSFFLFEILFYFHLGHHWLGHLFYGIRNSNRIYVILFMFDHIFVRLCRNKRKTSCQRGKNTSQAFVRFFFGPKTKYRIIFFNAEYFHIWWAFMHKIINSMNAALFYIEIYFIFDSIRMAAGAFILNVEIIVPRGLLIAADRWARIARSRITTDTDR